MLCCRLLWTLAFLPAGICHPIDWLRKLSPGDGERNGIWRWIWEGDSTISVLERTPPIVFISRPASFGADLNDALQGYLIPLSSFTKPCDPVNATLLPENDGCPYLCVRGPNVPDPADTWIALVQRGTCDFVSKAREAQRLGAKAVVVGGDERSPNTLLTMYSRGDASDVNIAATYIQYSDYNHLSEIIENSDTTHSGLRTVSLSISASHVEGGWYSPALTFITILMLPSLMTLATILVHRIRAARQARRDRAPEDVVRNLPWQVWTGSGWEKHAGPVPPLEPASEAEEMDAAAYNEQPSASAPARAAEEGTVPWFELQHECAICLSDFAKGDRVRVLPCNHIFHLDEVDDWLINRKKLCPVCKADVTRPPGSPSPETDDEREGADGPPGSPTERTPLLGERRESTE